MKLFSASQYKKSLTLNGTRRGLPVSPHSSFLSHLSSFISHLSSLISHLSSLQFKQRFTLVELLVVIAIISILAAILMPALSGVKETGRRANCLSNLKQFGFAFNQYDADFEKYPWPSKTGSQGTKGKATREAFEILRKLYMDAPRVFICPSTAITPADQGQEIKDGNFSYIYFTPTDTRSFVPKDAPSSGVVADGWYNDVTGAKWNHTSGAWLKLDASAARSEEPKWYLEVRANPAGGSDQESSYEFQSTVSGN